jgi:DNA-directed RNA polymerase specialized sigma24 family protein
MSRQISVVTVFVASPGGLSAERKIVRDVVERLNANIARQLGAQLALVMWEDEVPSFGRPQALINTRGDQADVFLGLIHRRWGSPTGEYSSGFEEEFERALYRRRRGRTPEMMLFFKNVDADSLADAGPQLVQVLAFQRRVETDKEMLYSRFSDTAEWREQVSEALTSFLINRRADEGVAEVAERLPPQRDANLARLEELKYSVAKAINTLPEAQKIVTTLRYYEGLRMDEIANLIFIAEEQVADLLDEALATVQDQVERHGFPPVLVEDLLRV